MKTFLKLLVLAVTLSVVVSWDDYCEMECEGIKHVGCDTYVYKILASYFYTVKTKGLEEFILDKVNSFRSLIATGQKPPFESASNMRLVTWNSEMEYLARRMKMNWDNPCCKTDTNPKSSVLWHNKFTDNESLVGFITSTFDEIFHNAFENRNASKLTHSRLYSAKLTSIGCAWTISLGVNPKVEWYLQCVLNEQDVTSLANAYLQGSPCSKCSPNNQICSERYPGLCEDVKVLPLGNIEPRKGDRGIDGPLGHVGDLQ